MEISWDLFKEYELWVVFIAYMVCGFLINRNYDKKMKSLDISFSEKENQSELDINQYQFYRTEIIQHKYFHYIGFWLVCITIILLGILITLLKN